MSNGNANLTKNLHLEIFPTLNYDNEDFAGWPKFCVLNIHINRREINRLFPIVEHGPAGSIPIFEVHRPKEFHDFYQRVHIGCYARTKFSVVNRNLSKHQEDNTSETRDAFPLFRSFLKSFSFCKFSKFALGNCAMATLEHIYKWIFCYI